MRECVRECEYVRVCESVCVSECVCECGVQRHGTGGQKSPHLSRFWDLNSGPQACTMNQLAERV